MLVQDHSVLSVPGRGRSMNMVTRILPIGDKKTRRPKTSSWLCTRMDDGR